MLIKNEGKLEIIGTVFNQTIEEKFELYKKSLLKYILSESEKSAGSYILHDPKNHILISSPGYSGGFISKNYISNTLQPIVNIEDEIKFKEVQLLKFFNHRISEFPPFDTFCENIYRIPPGAIINYKNHPPIYSPYLIKKKMKFEQLLERIIDPLFKKKKVFLMYSGGVDSTALLASIKNHPSIHSIEFHLITIDIGKGSNNHERAIQMGKKLDVNVEKLEFGWPPRNLEVISSIIGKMKKDFCNPLNPHHAFALKNDSGIAISGQNFDSFLINKMWRSQIQIYRHMITTKEYSNVILKLARNFLFTTVYQNNLVLRKLLNNLVKKNYSNTIHVDNSKIGQLAGLISNGIPCMINNEDELMAYNNAKIFMNFENKLFSTKCNYINYWKYAHNANKNISTLPSGNIHTFLPTMWAPFSNFYLEEKIGIRDFLEPKYEVYRYIKKKLNINYKSIAYDNLKEYKNQLKLMRAERKQYQDTILPKFKKKIYDFEFNQKMSKNFAEKFNQIKNMSLDVANGYKVNREDLMKCYRLLNVMLLFTKYN